MGTGRRECAGSHGGPPMRQRPERRSNSAPGPAGPLPPPPWADLKVPQGQCTSRPNLVRLEASRKKNTTHSTVPRQESTFFKGKQDFTHEEFKMCRTQQRMTSMKCSRKMPYTTGRKSVRKELEMTMKTQNEDFETVIMALN